MTFDKQHRKRYLAPNLVLSFIKSPTVWENPVNDIAAFPV